MDDDITARHVTITRADGTPMRAYLAQPSDAERAGERRGGVLVIHHLPGFDRWSKEVTRRLAVMGFDALLPDLYCRMDGLVDDPVAQVWAQGGIADSQLVDDARDAVAWLRAQPSSNGRVGVIGFCSGGRHAVLAGCQVPLDAIVDCYGAYVTGVRTPDFPLNVEAIVDQLPALSGPLLGIFGNDDLHPSPAHIDELEAELARLGKPAQIRRYDGAGHAFLNVDRDTYRADQALDAWPAIADFLHSTLD